MIEKLIEKAAIDAFDALELEGLTVDGFWQPAEGGTVKAMESFDGLAKMTVRAQPRSFQSFTSPVAEIPVSVALAILTERAPDGAALAAFAEPVANLLQSWQTRIADVKSVFTVEGFTPSAFRMDGGDAQMDKGSRAWTILYTFTLRGVISTPVAAS